MMNGDKKILTEIIEKGNKKGRYEQLCILYSSILFEFSTRKLAEIISDDLGVEVSKDTIFRAQQYFRKNTKPKNAVDSSILKKYNIENASKMEDNLSGISDISKILNEHETPDLTPSRGNSQGLVRIGGKQVL